MDILQSAKARRVFLVTDYDAFEKSGAKEKINPLLAGYEVEIFSDILPNPTIEQIERGISAFKKWNPDIIVAVGGGSAMDTAKALNVLSAQEGDPRLYVTKQKEISNQGKLLVAIPTTAGTGAETTQFAVVYIDKTKYSLAHPFVLPTYAIVDPQFTFNLPSAITSVTGMDALAQAIEAYWSVNSTEESKQYSREAISLIFKNISTAVNEPTEEARIAMSKGAYLAGRAINIAQTTACHSISYPFTSHFRIPHGHAVALTLPSMIVFNDGVTQKDCIDKRGVEYVKKTIKTLFQLMEVKSAIEAKEKMEQLMDAISLERTLRKLGIENNKDIDLIVENGFNPDRMKNNPRLLFKESLEKILKDIL